MEHPGLRREQIEQMAAANQRIFLFHFKDSLEARRINIMN